MLGISTYIPETNYVPREYIVAAILSLLFMVLISLVSVLNILYFYIIIITIIIIIIILWQYSPMRTLASLMDFSVVWRLFLIFNFAFIIICLYTLGKGM